MPDRFQRLIDAASGASLVVELVGRDGDFLQFTAGPDVIQIDHPLITPAQIARETTLRRELTNAGFEPYESRGSGGDRFLDCDIPADAAAAAVLVSRLFSALFHASSTSELRFIEND